MRVLCLLVIIAACGQSPGPDGIRSGSRLRAMFLEDADGVRGFVGFHDSALDANCSFSVDENSGVARCLPATLDETYQFTDPGCTVPVLVESTSPSCGAEPAYLGVASTSACQPGLSIWKVGPEIHPAMVYSGTPGACTGAPAPADQRYHAPGEPVPLDTFVAGTIETVGDHRLQDRVVFADDGARMPWTTFDRELGVDCYPDEGRCVPAANGPSAFLDDGCATGVVATASECAPYQPAYVTEFHYEGCALAYQVHQLGDPIAPATLYSGAPASCQQIDVLPDTSFWTLGATISNDSLIAITSMPDPGGPTRVAPYENTTDDGYRLATSRFYDRQLGTDCYTVELSDGHSGCVPASSAYAVPAFGDPQCATPVTVGTAYVGCNNTPPTAVLSWVSDSTCSGHVEMHQLGAEITSGTLYTTSSGSCVPMTWDPTQTRYYQVGAPIPDSTYDRFDPVTE